MRISDWSSDVCSSDLQIGIFVGIAEPLRVEHRGAQRIADILRRAGEQRGIEDARQDRVDANLLAAQVARDRQGHRSEEHTSELQSLMRISYAVLCLKK